MEILSRAHAEEAVLGVVCWQIGRGERDLGGVYRRSLSEEAAPTASAYYLVCGCMWAHACPACGIQCGRRAVADLLNADRATYIWCG